MGNVTETTEKFPGIIYCKNPGFYDFEMFRLMFRVPIGLRVFTFAHQLYNSNEIIIYDR